MPSMAPPSRWSCTPYSVAAADELTRELGISQVTAAVLVRRRHTTAGAPRHFLAADERHDPLELPGAREACEAILRHVAAGSQEVDHRGCSDGRGCPTTAPRSRSG